MTNLTSQPQANKVCERDTLFLFVLFLLDELFQLLLLRLLEVREPFERPANDAETLALLGQADVVSPEIGQLEESWVRTYWSRRRLENADSFEFKCLVQRLHELQLDFIGQAVWERELNPGQFQIEHFVHRFRPDFDFGTAV